MRMRTHRGSILILALAASAASAHDEVLIGHDGKGNLHVHKDIIEPLLLDQNFPGFPGMGGAPVGLTTPLADEPAEHLFVLDPSSQIVYVLISAEPDLTMYDSLTPMNPGDALLLGNPYFHFHAVWTIATSAMGSTKVLTGFARDLSGLYADSKPFTMSFTTPPPPCPGDHSGDRMVDFADITAALANWGAPFDFSAITATLANWGAVCP